MKVVKMFPAQLMMTLLCINPVFTFVCEKSATHCETSLIIDYAFTMYDKEAGQVSLKNGKLTKNGGMEELPWQNIITADGWDERRKLLVANGSMPGPDIIIHENQFITIIVHNKLLQEAVTIHWHGIDQLYWPYMDGVAYLTQCPILPGQTFNYTFQPTFGGTYWYHSHMGMQRDMGLFGAFIVLRPEDEKLPLSQQHILQLQEWNHLYDPIELLKTNKGMDRESQSILINGRGQFENNMAPLSVFNVEQHKNYHFRLIGVQFGKPFLFSVAGQKLNVIETDGFKVEPFVVDKIIINPAERYDVLLDLTHTKPGIYNISIVLLTGPLLEISSVSGNAYLNVSGGEFTADHNDADNDNLLDTEISILNCPFKRYPLQTHVTCIPVSDLKADGRKHDAKYYKTIIDKLKQPGTGQLNLLNTNESIDFRKFLEVLFPTNKSAIHFLNFAFPGNTSSVNGRQFILPDVSSLTQPSEVGNLCTDCGEEKLCKCSHSIDFKFGSSVTLVLLNLGTGASISHPIHMHGHTFKVLKMGFPEVLQDGKMVHNTDIQCSQTRSNENSFCNNASWRNSTWYDEIPDINSTNSVRKDTIIVPVGGYVVLNIEAYNFGVWFMHCHIDRHMIEGMALMLNESFEAEQYWFKPTNFPKCHSFDNIDYELSPKAVESLIKDLGEIAVETIVLIILVCLLFVVLLVVLFLCCKLQRQLKHKQATSATMDKEMKSM